MFSKEEYLTHLDYGVKTYPAIRDAFKELIENNFELIDRCNELERTIHSLDCELSDVYNPKPYKFEDLKPNMWVYDIKVKWLFKIISVDIGIEALKHYVFKVENRDGSTSLINFEENRFFPVQCANLND